MASKSKLHPADAATAQAVRDAAYFTATIRIDGQPITHELRTLDLARAAAALMPNAYQSSRKALVYVISKSGAQFLVPDDLVIDEK